MRAVLTLLLVLALWAGWLGAKEAHYGDGPRDSASALSGPAREIAFVANAVGGTISLVDTAEQKVTGSLNVIPDGRKAGFFRDPAQSFMQGMIENRGGLNYAQDTDISRDGTVLFVSRGFLGDVAAFDIASGAILWRTPIAGIRADHMAISPDGERLFVAALIRSGNIVEVLNTENGRKVGRFETGPWPHDLHVTPDGKKVYVASLGDMQLPLGERGENDAYRVTVADAASLNLEQEFVFEAGIRPFQVTRDETRLYAQLSNAHVVVARDLATDRQDSILNLPVKEGVTEDDWDFEAPHHGLALSPDEQTLCVAGRASDYAALVSGLDLSLLAIVPVGDAPSWSAITADGRFCLLANTRSDDISIVDLATQTETARLPAGRGPKHITIGLVPDTVLASVKQE